VAATSIEPETFRTVIKYTEYSTRINSVKHQLGHKISKGGVPRPIKVLLTKQNQLKAVADPESEVSSSGRVEGYTVSSSSRTDLRIRIRHCFKGQHVIASRTGRAHQRHVTL
jgi:hypothetical protein